MWERIQSSKTFWRMFAHLVEWSWKYSRHSRIPPPPAALCGAMEFMAEMISSFKKIGSNLRFFVGV